MKCKCGKSMKIRTNKKDGNKFWGCTGYPRCKHTKSVDQAVRNTNFVEWCKKEWEETNYDEARKVCKPFVTSPLLPRKSNLSKSQNVEASLIYGTQLKAKQFKEEQYTLYLQSAEWFHKRNGVLERDENTCRICGAKDNLQAHHITYDRIYNESPYDLVTVCTTCHKRIHA